MNRWIKAIFYASILYGISQFIVYKLMYHLDFQWFINLSVFAFGSLFIGGVISFSQQIKEKEIGGVVQDES